MYNAWGTADDKFVFCQIIYYILENINSLWNGEEEKALTFGKTNHLNSASNMGPLLVS